MGSVLTNEQMAASTIDRLAHHGHLLMASSRSYRIGTRPYTAGCSNEICLLTRPAESGEFPTMTMGNSINEDGEICLAENIQSCTGPMRIPQASA